MATATYNRCSKTLVVLYTVELREQKFPEACNAKGACDSEMRYSRQLGFRLWAFSET